MATSTKFQHAASLDKDDRETKRWALYAELPEITCKGHCHTECKAEVPVFPGEFERLPQWMGKAHSDGVSCPFLSEDKRCTVHEIRPGICRLYGVTKGLPCRWGCAPDRWMSEQEGSMWLRRLEAIEGM